MLRKGRVLTLDITAKLSQHEGWRGTSAIRDWRRMVPRHQSWPSATPDFSGIDAVIEDFLERLSRLPGRFGVKIHAYVLMPNHYHLILELGKPPTLSAAMHWLNTGYVKAFGSTGDTLARGHCFKGDSRRSYLTRTNA